MYGSWAMVFLWGLIAVEYLAEGSFILLDFPVGLFAKYIPVPQSLCCCIRWSSAVSKQGLALLATVALYSSGAAFLGGLL